MARFDAVGLSLAEESLTRTRNLPNQRGATALDRWFRLLPPASSPIEAATTEQKNDDYNDKKRGRVHDICVLSVSVFLNIWGPAARSACATYLRRRVAPWDWARYAAAFKDRL
jgi:hypothetical protein